MCSWRQEKQALLPSGRPLNRRLLETQPTTSMHADVGWDRQVEPSTIDST